MLASERENLLHFLGGGIKTLSAILDNPDPMLSQLIRAIRLSEGEFVLLLARCNSPTVRDRKIGELRSQLGDAHLFLWQASSEPGVVNLVEVLKAAPAGTKVACVVGLEASPYLHDLLAIANNAREEFRKHLQVHAQKAVIGEEGYQTLLRSLFVFEYRDENGAWFGLNPILANAPELSQ